MIEIKNRWTNELIRTVQAETLAGANLAGADLASADLYRADLAGANLDRADLAGANLDRADLDRADLAGADLAGANLCRANLASADLASANLAGANLCRANLASANLASADLASANLAGANLAGANLAGADLAGANLDPLVIARLSITPRGELVAYKRLVEGVAELRIPADARRSNATGRKCRAEWAVVVVLPNGCDVGHSLHDNTFEYRVGETVRPHEWCEDRWQECAGGIHFYLTREEAEAHQ